MKPKTEQRDQKERRFYTFEKRVSSAAESDGGIGRRMVGHAAVFNVETDLGYFVESIAPGAFTRTLADGDDVVALFNHDENNILGRKRANTLQLAEDETGLAFDCLLPDTSCGRDLTVSMDRGDIDQCSFGFYVRGEEVSIDDKGVYHRKITDAVLFDVSAVTYPAYKNTDVSLRSASAVFETFRRGPDNPDQTGDLFESERLMLELELVRNS